MSLAGEMTIQVRLFRQERCHGYCGVGMGERGNSLGFVPFRLGGVGSVRLRLPENEETAADNIDYPVFREARPRIALPFRCGIEQKRGIGYLHYQNNVAGARIALGDCRCRAIENDGIGFWLIVNIFSGGNIYRRLNLHQFGVKNPDEPCHNQSYRDAVKRFLSHFPNNFPVNEFVAPDQKSAVRETFAFLPRPPYPVRERFFWLALTGRRRGKGDRHRILIIP